MNIHAQVRPARAHRPAEPVRRRFTADELLAMEEKGILHPDERVELIDGEIITMAAKTPRHDDMCSGLLNFWARRLPADVSVAADPALRLSAHFEPDPDLVIFPALILMSQVRGDTALLVVEIAVTSISGDLKIKAPMYAAHGVREYWVVDARRLITHVHRDPGPSGIGSLHQVAAGEPLAPLLVPALALRLADLGFEPLANEDESA